MRKDFGVKTWLYPQPVFVVAAYGSDGVPDAMCAAWGGITYDTRLSICLDNEHKIVENIVHSGAFTVSMATEAYAAQCDYLGIVSGHKVPDKVERSGLHTERAEHVNAPIISELPLTVECTLVSYDAEECLLVGEIVNVSADESILDADGKLDVGKLRPITYDPVRQKYRVVGEVVADAFRAGLAVSRGDEPVSK